MLTVEEREKTERFLYKGDGLLGRLFTLDPPALFLVLSIPFTVLLFVPATALHVHLITHRTAHGLRPVGLLQNQNWSLMFPLVLPLLFAGTAWVSNEMRKSVEGLAHPDTNLITPRSLGASGYVRAFAEELAKSGKALRITAIVLTVVFSLIDVSTIIKGSLQWFNDHAYQFAEADADWTVAFTFKDNNFQQPWFPAANLAFDGVAYLLQGCAIFLGLFWVGKFLLFIKTFVGLISSVNAPYQFEPMRHDFHRRLGLGAVGRLFNYFASLLLVFQAYVFLHRLQIVARDGCMGVTEFLMKIYDMSKKLQNPFQVLAGFAAYSTIRNIGIWLLLVVTTVVVLWLLKLMFSLKTYLESRKQSLWSQYRRELDRAQGEGDVGKIISIESDMKELRESTAWINGDDAGPRFVVALLTLTVVAWLPPILAYATPVGVLSYLFPPLKSLRKEA